MCLTFDDENQYKKYLQFLFNFPDESPSNLITIIERNINEIGLKTIEEGNDSRVNLKRLSTTLTRDILKNSLNSDFDDFDKIIRAYTAKKTKDQFIISSVVYAVLNNLGIEDLKKLKIYNYKENISDPEFYNKNKEITSILKDIKNNIVFYSNEHKEIFQEEDSFYMNETTPIGIISVMYELNIKKTNLNENTYLIFNEDTLKLRITSGNDYFKCATNEIVLCSININDLLNTPEIIKKLFSINKNRDSSIKIQNVYNIFNKEEVDKKICKYLYKKTGISETLIRYSELNINKIKGEFFNILRTNPAYLDCIENKKHETFNSFLTESVLKIKERYNKDKEIKLLEKLAEIVQSVYDVKEENYFYKRICVEKYLE